MVFIQADQRIQRAYQLLQTTTYRVQQLLMKLDAMLLLQLRGFLETDQQVAQGSAARFNLAQAVGHAQLQIAQVAQTSDRINQVALLKIGNVARQHAIALQQTLQVAA